MQLTHSAAEILRKYLVDQGLAAWPPATPWPASVSREQDTPDNAITVYDTQGTDDGRLQIDGVQQDIPGAQVQIRALTHSVGRAKAEAIKAALEAAYLVQVNIGGTRYTVWQFDGIGQILPLGPEKPSSNRLLWTVNATLVVEEN